MDGGVAWRALETWLELPQITFHTFLNEPVGLNELLGQWARQLDVRSGEWTDAYLAAFCDRQWLSLGSI
jgi:hypothetical protein